MHLLELSLLDRMYIGIGAMVMLFTSFLFVFITSQRKKIQYHKNMRAMSEEKQRLLTEQNEVLEKKVLERTSELEEQKEALEHSLQNLKATQLQLIQKEKMASLGELTAGIAHEIQNPLNFVNNFSEVNTELLLEIKELLQNETISFKGNEDITGLVDTMTDNLQKISFHGKRADGIVKGMLQHSRNTSGEKAPVDINALSSEYLKLSYHGLRAKDKNFNASMIFNLDKIAGEISVVPQEIGRVLLNLFNNAFYAVTEKKRMAGELALENYEPTVTLTTKKLPGGIEISVKDNGRGIPEKIADKIFQPFFTTKPSGQGTGLGLSLSYDIVTKSHRGEMKVNTKENEYTEFIITLPEGNEA